MDNFRVAIYAIILRRNALSIRVIYPVNQVPPNRNKIKSYTCADVTGM